MKSVLLILILMIAVLGQRDRFIGEIDFYSYAGLDVDKVRAALPVHEGDQFSDSAFLDTVNRIKAAVTKVIGKPPTDIAVVCCGASGNQMIYIGLPGKSIKNVPYNPSPKTNAHLPGRVIDLYQANGVPDGERKLSLTRIDCLICRHAKFRSLASHGTP